jgi:hypothetical protein
MDAPLYLVGCRTKTNNMYSILNFIERWNFIFMAYPLRWKIEKVKNEKKKNSLYSIK